MEYFELVKPILISLGVAVVLIFVVLRKKDM